MSVRLPHQFNGSFNAPYSAPDGAFVFEAAVISLASLAGLLTNIFNIFVVPRLPGTSLASKIFYIMLFITDIFGSLTAFLTLPGFFLRRWIFGETFCLIFTFVWNTYPRITSTCLFLLAIDRHIYVTRPLRYEQIVTKIRIGFVTACFLSQNVFDGPVSLLFTSSKPIITFFPYAGACDWATSEVVSTDNIITSCWSCILLVTIICLHSHIACITRRHSKSIKTRQNMAPMSAVNTVSMSNKTEQTTEPKSAAVGMTPAFSETSSTHPKAKPEQVNLFQVGTSSNVSGKTEDYPTKGLEAFQEHDLVEVSKPSPATPITPQEVGRPSTKEAFPKADGDPQQEGAEPRDKVDPPRPSAEWKAVKLAILLSGAFFLGFLPEAIYKSIQNFNDFHVYQLFIAIHLLYMNRVWWNALIFYYGRKAYRLKAQKLFRCLRQKRVANFNDS